MNRRQKRKQFKKVFGMNPEQYEAWWAEHWPELLHERLREAQRAAGEGLNEMARQVREMALNAAADMEEIRKRVAEAAEFMRGGEQNGNHVGNSKNDRVRVPDRIGGHGADGTGGMFCGSIQGINKKELGGLNSGRDDIGK